MSEIKGQLLGIILVITIFGAVSTAVAAIFTNLTAAVENEVSKEVDGYVKSKPQYLHYQ